MLGPTSLFFCKLPQDTMQAVQSLKHPVYVPAVWREARFQFCDWRGCLGQLGLFVIFPPISRTRYGLFKGMAEACEIRYLNVNLCFCLTPEEFIWSNYETFFSVYHFIILCFICLGVSVFLFCFHFLGVMVSCNNRAMFLFPSCENLLKVSWSCCEESFE